MTPDEAKRQRMEAIERRIRSEDARSKRLARRARYASYAADVAGALGVACPKCAAQPQAVCLTRDGRVHQVRRLATRK